MWAIIEVEFLGMDIAVGGVVKMLKSKVEGVLLWKEPQTVRGVRKFLGFANFYPRFIQDFAKHTRLLHYLTKKDALWKWEEAEQHAFNELKAKFCEYSVLVIPDVTKPF